MLTRGLLQVDAHTRAALQNTLDFLPVLYPGGWEWLHSTFTEIEAGAASLTLRYVGDELVGVGIGKRKSGNRFKICTMFVAPDQRGRGLGKSILDEMLEIAGNSSSYITGAHTVRDTLFPLLESRGFDLSHTVPNRYGSGRHEDVFLKGSAV